MGTHTFVLLFEPQGKTRWKYFWGLTFRSKQIASVCLLFYCCTLSVKEVDEYIHIYLIYLSNVPQCWATENITKPFIERGQKWSTCFKSIMDTIHVSFIIRPFHVSTHIQYRDTHILLTWNNRQKKWKRNKKRNILWVFQYHFILKTNKAFCFCFV